MLRLKLLAATTVVAGFVLYVWYTYKKTENYQIALGMLAPQNYFYAKCTNDCVRDKTGDSSTGQFQWLCTDKCAEIAKAREKHGIPDISRAEYQRYYADSMPGTYWSSPYLESAYCMRDIEQWCREKYCPFSNHSDCMKGCINMRGVDCAGTLVAGGQP